MWRLLTVLLSPEENPGGGTDPVDPVEEPKQIESDPDPAESKKLETDPEIDRWKREATKARREAEELRKWKESKEQAEMTEIEKARAEAEKAKAEAEQARTEARELRLAGSIRDSLSEAGLGSPDALIVSGVRTALELGDDGTPTNLADVVEGFKSKYPALFGEVESEKKTATSSGENKPEGGDRGPGEEKLTDAERAKAARERFMQQRGRL